MNFTLYRKMSIEEVEVTTKAGIILPPVTQIQLPRKWFSTSLFRSHYFRNPFCTGESKLIKVNLNENYFERIIKEGKMLKREANGYYAVGDGDEAYLVARAHKGIDDLYNIGVLDLDTFNGEINSIEVMDNNYYLDDLAESLLGDKIDAYLKDKSVSSKYEFYMQVNIDVAMLMLKYQTLIREGINPIIKYYYFLKDRKELEKWNLGKFSVTLLVRFSPYIENVALFNERGFRVGRENFEKIIRYIERIDLVDYQKTNCSDYKEFLEVSGDNDYGKHRTLEYEHYDYVDYDRFNVVTECLVKDGFSLDDISELIPRVLDVYGVMQVDPRHIDGVKSHIEKAVNMSNLVINYLQKRGVSLSSSDIVRIKWVLLIHDLGKPYCECENMLSRYSQFGMKDYYSLEIAKDMLSGDFLVDVMGILKVMKLHACSNKKSIRVKLDEVKGIIREYYGCSEELVEDKLLEYVKMGFVCKVSNETSLKMRKFCASFVDEVHLLEKMEGYFKGENALKSRVDYSELYFVNMEAYEEIVEAFYEGKSVCTLEVVQSIGSSLQDSLYDIKNQHKHHIVDSQLEVNDLIGLYWNNDDELLREFFSEEVSDKSVHGVSHSNRVGVLTYMMGKIEGLSGDDLRVLLLASKYHDIGRVHDNDDKVHGLVAVNMLREVGFDDERKEYVYFLIESHAIDDKDVFSCLDKYDVDRELALRLWRIFKDGDALDRVRFDKYEGYGSALNIKYLRNDYARKLVKFAYVLVAKWGEDVKKLRPDMMRLILES